MAKAREPKVFRSMDDLPLMLTPYDLMDFLGKGQRQTYELIHSEGFPYVQDGPKIKIPKWLLIEFINEKPETSVLFTAVQNTPYRKPLRKWGFVRAFQSVRRS